jgi:hypothetical protein
MQEQGTPEPTPASAPGHEEQELARASQAQSAAAEQQATRGPAGETVIHDDPDVVPTQPPDPVTVAEEVEQPATLAVTAEQPTEASAKAEEEGTGLSETLANMPRRELSRLNEFVQHALRGKGEDPQPAEAGLEQQIGLMTRHEDIELEPAEALGALEAYGVKGLKEEDIVDVAVRSKLDMRKRPTGQHYVRVVTSQGGRFYAPIGTEEDPPKAPAETPA